MRWGDGVIPVFVEGERTGEERRLLERHLWLIIRYSFQTGACPVTGKLKKVIPLSSPLHTEVLYGTGPFRVRMIHLAPAQTLTLRDSTGETDWLAIQNGLMVVEAGTAQTPLPAGKHVSGPAGQELTLLNPTERAVLLLEVARDPQAPSLALAEVTEVRPWGSFTVLKDEPDYKLKQLMVTPGKRLSLQRHQKREEHWLVLAGTPEVTVDAQVLRPQVGEYVEIPLHAWHRLANPGEGPVEIIELQLGEYFGEDDIERREDDFGRV